MKKKIKKRPNPITDIQSNGKVRSYYIEVVRTLLHALSQGSNDNNVLLSFNRWNSDDQSALFFHTRLKNGQKLLFKFTPFMNLSVFNDRVIDQSSGFSEIVVSSLLPFDTKETVLKLIEHEIERRLWGSGREERVLRLWNELSEDELKNIIGKPRKASKYEDMIKGIDDIIPILGKKTNGKTYYATEMPFNSKSNPNELWKHREKHPRVPASCIKTEAPSRDEGDKIIKEKLIKITYAYINGSILFLE